MEDFEDCCDLVKNKINCYPELCSNLDGALTINHVIAAFTDADSIVPSIFCQNVNKNNVNCPDCLGRVLLHYAVINQNVQMVKFLLEVGADPNIRVNDLTNPTSIFHNAKLWKLIKEMPLSEEPTTVHTAAKNANVEILALLLEYRANVNSKAVGDITPLMLAATNRSNKAGKAVQLLLEYGADVNLLDEEGHSVLFYATVHRNVEAVELLLKAGVWLTKDKNQQTPMHEAAKRGTYDILFLFLHNPLCDETYINDCDAFGRTPLYWAASCVNIDCFKLLIRYNASITAGEKDNKDTTMHAVFALFPEPLEHIKEIFDEKMHMEDSKHYFEDSMIVMDFSVLAPFHEEKQMEVIEQMLLAAGSESGAQILQHPLVETFIRLKWRKIVYFFYLQLITHFFFTLISSIYVLMIVHKSYVNYHDLFNWVRIIMVVLATCLLCHASVQCFLELIANNILDQCELWSYLLCNVFAIVVGSMGLSVLQKSEKNDVPEWFYNLSSIAVLLNWFQMTSLIGRIPSFGIYVLMFSVVLRNVIKVLCVFLCLMIGFAISLSILFRNVREFSSPVPAFVKIAVMMVGEYDYSVLLESLQNEELQFLAITACVVLFVFMVLIAIVLVNLLVGLAVSDIQNLRTEGKVKGLQECIKFLRQLEDIVYSPLVNSKFFPKFFRVFLRSKCTIKQILKILPNSYKGKKKRQNKKLPTHLIDSIVIKLKRKKNACEKLQDVELKRFLNCLHTVLDKYDTTR